MTEEVSSKLSLLTRKLAEVGQLKGEIADKLFEEADAGIITKEQALEILQRYDRDREVMIHTLKGETVDVNGYFVQRDLDDNGFYLTNLDVIPSG